MLVPDTTFLNYSDIFDIHVNEIILHIWGIEEIWTNIILAVDSDWHLWSMATSGC